MTRITRTPCVCAIAAAGRRSVRRGVRRRRPTRVRSPPVQPDRVLDTRRPRRAPAGRPGPVVTLPITGGRRARRRSSSTSPPPRPPAPAGCGCGRADARADDVGAELRARADRGERRRRQARGAGAVCLSTSRARPPRGRPDRLRSAGRRLHRHPARADPRHPRETRRPAAGRRRARLRVAGRPASRRSAASAALNLTVVEPPVDGWVVAYPCGSPTTASTVNFTAGEIVANLTFVGARPAATSA